MKYGTRYCFLPACVARLLERVVELREIVGVRLLHQREHCRVGVLGRDLQVPADVVRGQLAHVLGTTAGQVHANARGDAALS